MTTISPTEQCDPLVRDIDDERWNFVYQEFMSLVDDELRSDIEHVIKAIHGNGGGLRYWINDIAYRGRVMPSSIPKTILATYLLDPEALPLHDCADCGISVPIRPSRLYGCDGDPEVDYFPHCPVCGGRTGLYCYWSNRSASDYQRLLKPR